jgi:hypothetical protein
MGEAPALETQACRRPRCNVDASPEARTLHRRTADKFGRVRWKRLHYFLRV